MGNYRRRSRIEGAYRGATGIRRFFSDIASAGPDFRVEIERIEALGSDRVLTFMRITATGRESGVDMGAETANVYDLIDGKIQTIAIYLNRDEGRRAAGLATVGAELRFPMRAVQSLRCGCVPLMRRLGFIPRCIPPGRWLQL
jgi:SnoaL-like domain